MVEYKFDKDAFGIVLFASLENENKRRIRVVLDTGATFLMIPLNIAEELGCKPKTSKEFVNLTTATSVISAPIVVIKKVDVLGKIVENVKAVVHDLPESSRVDGLLGLSFLKNFKVEIDFKNGILRME